MSSDTMESQPQPFSRIRSMFEEIAAKDGNASTSSKLSSPDPSNSIMGSPSGTLRQRRTTPESSFIAVAPQPLDIAQALKRPAPLPPPRTRLNLTAVVNTDADAATAFTRPTTPPSPATQTVPQSSRPSALSVPRPPEPNISANPSPPTLNLPSASSRKIPPPPPTRKPRGPSRTPSPVPNPGPEQSKNTPLSASLMTSADSSSQDGGSSTLSTSLSGMSLRKTTSSVSAGTSVYEDATSEEMAREGSLLEAPDVRDYAKTALATALPKDVSGMTNSVTVPSKPLTKPMIPPRANTNRLDTHPTLPPALPARVSQTQVPSMSLLAEPVLLSAAPDLPPRRMASPSTGAPIPFAPPIHPQSGKLMSQVHHSSDDVLLSNSLKRARKMISGPPSPKLRGRPTSSAETTRAGGAALTPSVDTPTSTLPPPPQRNLNVGDPLPTRREIPRLLPSSSDEGSELDSSPEDRSSVSPAATSSTSTLPTSIAAGGPSSNRLRTSDDFPDTSGSSRRPPFASDFVHRGQSMGFFAPHRGVSAVASDVLCVAKHDLAIYDLQTFRTSGKALNEGLHQTQRDLMATSSTSPAIASSLQKPSRLIHLKDLEGTKWRTDRPTVTALAFAPSGVRPSPNKPVVDGSLLWLGTKDGQIVELDTTLGSVRTTKSNLHKAAITHILRHESSMITLDETGKSTVFAFPSGVQGSDEGEFSLLDTVPRISRIADKQHFAQMIFGRLWTSDGVSQNSNDTGPKATPKINNTSTTSLGGSGQAQSFSSKVAVLRVYDLFASSSIGGPSASTQLSGSLPNTASPPVANQAATRVITEAGIGCVTSATTIMTQPGLVYVGHQGGCVTVWDVSSLAQPNSRADSINSVTFDVNLYSSPPRLLQTLNISGSDIICMTAVHTKLWIGSRNGYISAHDVGCRPWNTTNNWRHCGIRKSGDSAEEAKLFSPVLQLLVDAAGVEKNGKLTVFSIGRDETIRCWDGFFGEDWIDAEVKSQEPKFTTVRPIKVLVCTWNVGASKPESLFEPSNSGLDNSRFLPDLFSSVDPPDILVFGFQEMIDLDSRKMAAKTVIMGSNNSHKVSRSYQLWTDRLILSIRSAMPSDCPYSIVHTENLVGLYSCIFVKQASRSSLRHATIGTVKTGMGGHYGNKGAIVSRVVFDDSSLCFINCHLAAGQAHKTARNHDLGVILEDKSVFPTPHGSKESVVFVRGGDGSMILDHEVIFLAGDLNYRIDQHRESVIANIRAGDLKYLTHHDQLSKEMKHNRLFLLRTFREAPITFTPTYKYDRHSCDYDTSQKKRVPAWCDRILHQCRNDSTVKPLHYKRYEVTVSDHRPVSAAFEVNVKKIDFEVRQSHERRAVRAWEDVQKAYARDLFAFYRDSGCI